MKQQLRALVLVLLAAGAVAGLIAWRSQQPTQPRSYQPQGPGQVYMALGDSLATGFRLADPGRESYVALLGERLHGRGVGRIRNLGVAGATSAALLRQQIPQALEVLAQAKSAGQRVSPITIDIGGNDLRALEQADAATRSQQVAAIGSNIAAALDALQAASAGSDIALMTYYDPYGGDPSIAGSDAYWVEQLNATIRQQARAHGVAVAEVYPVFAGGKAYEYTNMLLGDIHANSRGHALIAEQFWQALGYEAK